MPSEVREAIRAQDNIGWKNFLEGLPAKQWRLLQDRHYRRIRRQDLTARSWMKRLLTRLHVLGWSQWKHRNDTLYDRNMKWQKLALKALDASVAMEFARGPADLPPQDSSHFSLPLIVLLKKHQDYKKQWLVNVTSARNRQARGRSEAEDAVAASKAHSAVLHWCKTGRLPR